MQAYAILFAIFFCILIDNLAQNNSINRCVTQENTQTKEIWQLSKNDRNRTKIRFFTQKTCTIQKFVVILQPV